MVDLWPKATCSGFPQEWGGMWPGSSLSGHRGQECSLEVGRTVMLCFTVVGVGWGGWVGETAHQVASELISCWSWISWWPPYFKMSGHILMLFPSLFLLVSLKAKRLVQEVGLPRVYLEMTPNRRRCVTVSTESGMQWKLNNKSMLLLFTFWLICLLT